MKTFNPQKKLKIEIHNYDMSRVMGPTVWHILNKYKTSCMKRNCSESDFDWMDEKQMKDYENGQYKFTISAQDAANFFNYLITF